MSASLLRRSLRVLAALCYPQNNCCHLCGHPLLEPGEQWLCASCQRVLDGVALTPGDQPFFLHEQLPSSFAAFAYESAARELVQKLKYGGDRFCARPLAQGMAAVLALESAERLQPMDLLLPVPLHPSRQRLRGFNQAETLCHALAFHTGLPVASRALRRVRATRSQVSFNHSWI